MSERHAMDLNEYARLARIREYPPHADGRLIIITPTLARALDALIEVANDCVVAGPLADALADVKRLHNFEDVRLGGGGRDAPPADAARRGEGDG